MSEGLQLVMSQGPNPGRAYEIGRASSTIGRDPSNEITINQAQVSRLHARVSVREGGVVIEDMGSTNGTYVNGVRLTGPHTLTPGDVIGLGESVTLTFYSTGTPSTASMSGPAASAPDEAAPASPEPRPGRRAAKPARQRGVGAHSSSSASGPGPCDGQPGWDKREEDVDDEDREQAKRRQRMLIGCGCLALALACAAVAVFLWYAPATFWEFLIRLGIPVPPNPF